MKKQPDFDAVVVGAGVTGMYQTYRLREAGFNVKGIDGSSGVGGSWHVNRYPGCRVDSESHTYSYFWNPELLEEFNWTELFASQPEVLRYLNRAADYMDIRKDYMFNTRIKKSVWDEENQYWVIHLEEGGAAPLTTRYLFSAMGPLSAPQMPRIDGVHTFRGEMHHTGRWPRDPNGFGGAPVDFKGKRVGVVGTGASGVQVIQEAAKEAGELYVFQRSPNWCTPLGNRKFSDADMAEIKSQYEEINELCETTLSGFAHKWIDKSALEVSDEEREATFEKLYYGPGFSFWLGTFKDVLYDKRANDYATDFVRRKIRSRVKDQKIADKLIPTDHGYGTRRVPLETNYFEVYNQDNVTLVDLKETPIERVTPKGIKTGDDEYELDILIWATGFDAIVGSLGRVDIVGEKGVTLKEAWADGVQTYLGLQIVGFPNLFTLIGPQNGTVFCNLPRCSVTAIDWITQLMVDARAEGATRIEPTRQAQHDWNELCHELLGHSLLGSTNSWFTGVNNNIPGRQVRQVLFYAGGNPKFKALCKDIRDDDYRGFIFSDAGDKGGGKPSASAREAETVTG